MREFQRPSAWPPLAMSGIALAIVVHHHLSFYGAAPEADEGAAAHVWQLLMIGQVPIIAWCAFNRSSNRPRRRTRVLAAQLLALLLALAPVYLLGL